MKKLTDRIILFVLAWIVCINVFALISWNRLNVLSDTSYGWIGDQNLPAPSWDFRMLPARWDSEWYLSIARGGYVFNDVQSLSNIVFFPLYPLFIRVVAPIAFGNLVVAGWFISLACLIAGCVMLSRLVREFHAGIDAEESVIMMLIFPTAIFFNAVYTEAIFLFLTVSTVYFARKRRFAAASALGVLAAVTRVTGVLLFVPLAIEAYLAWRERKLKVTQALPLLAIPAAATAFFAFHWIRYGDPLLFFKIESVWGRSFSLNREHFLAASSAAHVNLGLDVFFTVLALASVVVIWKKIRPSYAIYTLLGLIVPISTGTLMSIGRYALVLFPIHMAMATLPPFPRRVWKFFSILLLGLYTTLYAHGYWVG